MHSARITLATVALTVLAACGSAVAAPPDATPTTVERPEQDRSGAVMAAGMVGLDHSLAVHRWEAAVFFHTLWNRAVENWYRGAAVTAQEERQEALAASTTDSAYRRPTVAVAYGDGRCGGALPPCSVMACESGGSLTAENPTSSASGKWQILASTWGGFMGYPTASSAPEWVQDARAAQIWAGGANASAWAACL